jgi:hypothetical protein
MDRLAGEEALVRPSAVRACRASGDGFTAGLLPPEQADAKLDDFVGTFILPAVRGA